MLLNDTAKQLFADLKMPYPAVAIKFSYSQPEGVEHVDEVLSFCQFVKKAQTEQRAFFTTVSDDNCMGKVMLGMTAEPPMEASGQVGFDFGCYETHAAASRQYYQHMKLIPGSVNFVQFCPVALCDFAPDLVMCVAEPEQAHTIMRATSYISGDLWESKCSHVMSCSWMYVYPYVTGKVNFCITGLHHGLKRRKIYPAGLHMIVIPYQKLPEVVASLERMDWQLLAMREDPEGKKQMAEKMAGWAKLSPNPFITE